MATLESSQGARRAVPQGLAGSVGVSEGQHCPSWQSPTALPRLPESGVASCLWEPSARAAASPGPCLPISGRPAWHGRFRGREASLSRGQCRAHAVQRFPEVASLSCYSLDADAQNGANHALPSAAAVPVQLERPCCVLFHDFLSSRPILLSRTYHTYSTCMHAHVYVVGQVQSARSPVS